MKIALRHTAMLALIFIASTLGTLSRAADSAAPSFVGTWQGTLDAGAFKLRIVFEIKAADGGLAGTMDSPDQRQYGLKLDTVKQDGGNVTAELNMIGGAYNGTFSTDGAEIVGKWSQGGMSLPLTLHRGEKITPAKWSQEPVPPLLRVDNRDVGGPLDMQTPPRQSFPAVEAALKAAKNGDVTMQEIPGVSHVLQTANTGMPVEYTTIEEKVSPVVLKLVGGWVVHHAGTRPHG